MKHIAYHGSQADTRFHDGALRYVSGACNIQVMRANREYPELSQGTDYTYNHAPMICRWRGRIYLMYLSSPVHEHVGCAQALMTSSADGFTWDTPRVIFPSIEVPRNVYCGKDADRLEYPAHTVVHHRMGFYIAHNGLLLAMTHHGVCPHRHAGPNSGYGMGRTVRRVFDDGSFGDIHVLRINTQAGWRKEHFPYPWFEESTDTAFIDACHALLGDNLANGAWWEEERLDEDFFPLKGMRAPSYIAMPDGNIAAIGKVGMTSISTDGGKTWSAPQKAEGICTSGGKCCITRTGDGRYAIACNPSPDGQHRWPLAIMTSENGYDYSDMLCICGEVPPMRYGGYLKNFGPNYVRTIMHGNDDSPDGYTWLTYSMNKEDIWVVRLPRTIAGTECASVHDIFSEMNGAVPEKWNIYSPLWAQVKLENGCLTIRDSDPWDYAKAVRNFPASENATVRIRITPYNTPESTLHMELSDSKGMPACRLIFSGGGKIFFRAGEGEWPLTDYTNGEEIDAIIAVDCRGQKTRAIINGIPSKEYQLMCPVETVERLTLRTGNTRTWPTPEDNLKNICLPDYANPGTRLEEARFSISEVHIE